MSLCAHFEPGSYPFDVMLVLDDHLGPTDALIRCRDCSRTYLLEMLDWQGTLRLFRISEPDEDAAGTLLRDLQRGSCDLKRAEEELGQFAQSSLRLPQLLLVDSQQRRILRCVDPGRTLNSDGDAGVSAAIPSAGWRELPCDGRWIRRVQDARL